MPPPLEQIEVRLKVLEAETQKRREPQVNPFESLEIQLALENGHTISARTRRVRLGNRSGGDLDFPDGSTTSENLEAIVPSDWVLGTDITVNVMLLQIATGGSPLAVLNSYIGVEKVGDTLSDTNIENAVYIGKTYTQNIVTGTSRTISGASIEADDRIQWRIERVGGHANDAINGTLRFRSAWIEYTAFF